MMNSTYPLNAGDAASHLAADSLLLAPDHLMLREGPVRDHAVLVESGKFRDIGPAEVLAARYPHLTPLRLPGKVLMPGMIDAHLAQETASRDAWLAGDSGRWRERLAGMARR